MRIVLAVVLSIILIACGGGDSLEDFLDYNEAKVQWQASNNSDYTFNYRVTGDTTDTILGRWEIQVVNGRVFFVMDIMPNGSVVQLDLEDAPTVDDLYEQINDCIGDQDCDITSQQYHERIYYPISVRMLYQGGDRDGFELSDFTSQ